MKAALLVVVPVMVAWFLCRWLICFGERLLDHPNERSLHETPVPRGGGIGILAGIAVALFFLPSLPVLLLWLVCLTLALGAFSLLDDLFHLSPVVRFLVQAAVAALLVGLGLWTAHLPVPGSPGWPVALGMFFSGLWLVWMTNLYNFMDGMDGFAGGMALIGFGALAVLGWLAGDTTYALLCAAVASAAGGFLCFNFPPARLFMGDVGSTALGFLAAGLLLWADRSGLFPLWVGMLVFSPFIVDATVTLVGRLLRGERVWEAHRNHYYQRLVQMGWGHRKTVLWEYGLMLLCALSAALAVNMSPAIQWGIVILWMGIYGGLIWAVERAWKRLSVKGGND